MDLSCSVSAAALLCCPYCLLPLNHAARAAWFFPLFLQLTSPVQWETTLQTLLEKGLDKSYEVGPGKVIAGILKRIDKKAVIENVVA
jgi:hypothetical protein